MESKNEIRRKYKLKRLQLGIQKREEFSDQITKNVVAYLLEKSHIQHIHVFLPINQLNEINTFPLIKILQQQNKVIYTSISNLESKEMTTVKLSENHDFAPDKYGIPVPSVWQQADESLIELVVMPLLAYDLKGHRLGYGMGFYDKFLSQFPKEVVKAGLSFFPPENQIPSEPHDIPLDLCINPKETIVF